MHYFHITNEGESQSLKNDGSKRRVPVHSDLIRIGFLEYVATLRKQKCTRLFPKLQKGENGFGKTVGKWFSQFIRSLGITDPAIVLHSARHTVTTRLHAAGVPRTWQRCSQVTRVTRCMGGCTYIGKISPSRCWLRHWRRFRFQRSRRC